MNPTADKSGREKRKDPTIQKQVEARKLPDLRSAARLVKWSCDVGRSAPKEWFKNLSTRTSARSITAQWPPGGSLSSHLASVSHLQGVSRNLHPAQLISKSSKMCDISAGDTTWVLLSSMLVLTMMPALAFFEAGLLRTKNSLSIISQV